MLSVATLRHFAAGYAVLGLLSSCALPLVSESEIEDEGAKEFQKMKGQQPQTTDARTRSYVNCVADAITAQLEEPYRSKNWEVVVFESDEVNAFALPGGYIGVYSGIFKVAENQNELATVLGHEVAHVTHKHALQRADRELTTQAGVVAGAAVLGGGQMTASALGAAAQLGLSLPFSRQNESQADLAGLDYMAAAGFKPTDAIPLWKNMEKTTKAGPPQFLSTHPASENRIQDLIKELPEALQRYNQARAAGKNPRCQR